MVVFSFVFIVTIVIIVTILSIVAIVFWLLLLPNRFSDGALTHFDGTGDELGDIVGVQLIVVEGARVTLGKDECLGALAFVIDIGEMGTDIESVDASAAEGNPAAVVTPGMIAFAVARVGSFKWPHFARLLVAHPEVRFLVVDGEVAALLTVIDEPTTVG